MPFRDIEPYAVHTRTGPPYVFFFFFPFRNVYKFYESRRHENFQFLFCVKVSLNTFVVNAHMTLMFRRSQPLTHHRIVCAVFVYT